MRTVERTSPHRFSIPLTDTQADALEEIAEEATATAAEVVAKWVHGCIDSWLEGDGTEAD